MPSNLRDGLTSGASTASKKRRPGNHYLESPFFTFQTRFPNTSRIVHPFHFISRLGFDSAPSQQLLTSFFCVYYTDNTQYITLCTTPPPPAIPRNAMILRDLLLSTRGVRT
jgi:hypothetical protein